jgi:thiol-disulfide isomerase/thioredoxin
LLGLFLGCTIDSDKNEDIIEERNETTDTTVDTEDAEDTEAPVDTDTTNSDDSAADTADSDDSAADTGTGGSLIHGGNPAVVTWTDCNQWPGSHPCDFSLVDQYGDTFTLYDNYDTVMVLDFSTMWCSVCKSIAPDVQIYQDTYGSQGFLWVTVLIEDAQGDDPDETDIQDWATTYGIVDSPVLAGNREDFVDLTGMTGYPISVWPTLVVIDRGMVLYNGLNGWNENVILGWVEANL